MSSSRSAQKAGRVADKKRIRNRSIRSATNSVASPLWDSGFSNEPDPASETVLGAIRTLDRAAQKGVIHPNNAARHKSHLMKKLNRAQALVHPVGKQAEDESGNTGQK